MFEIFKCFVQFEVYRFAIGDFYKTHCEQGNDIVILELESTIDDVEGANYACLPFLPEVNIQSGANVTSFGWGSDPGKGFDNAAFPMIQVLTLGRSKFYNAICVILLSKI